jgi:hypothetical protein
MFDFNDIKVARKQVTDKRSGSAETAYSEALIALESYRQTPTVTKLNEAGKKFIEALEYNSEHVPSIIYLSYVLYALENEPMALKYIKMAERYKTPLPPEILRYKHSIEMNIG